MAVECVTDDLEDGETKLTGDNKGKASLFGFGLLSTENGSHSVDDNSGDRGSGKDRDAGLGDKVHRTRLLEGKGCEI